MAGNKPPTLTLTVTPTSITLGETVDVDLTGTDPEGKLRASAVTLRKESPDLLARVTLKPSVIGDYEVRGEIEDANGKHAEETVNLTVTESDIEPPTGEPPTILTQPQGVTVPLGQQAMVSVVADGDEPLTYQWHNGNTVIAGQTGSVCHFAPTTNASVWCRVGNMHGSVDSEAATVVVTVPVPPGELGLVYRRSINIPSCYAAFTYGDCTGRVVDGKLHILFTGDQPNVQAPVYEVRITDAPVAEWVREYMHPYGGRRGTYMPPASLRETVTRLEKAMRVLTDGTDDARRGLLLEFGSDLTVEKVITALAINRRLHTAARAKAKSETEWVFCDFDAPGSTVPVASSGHYWHPGKNLLYYLYADTYNVTSRPDCNVLALRLHDDGTTEAFGPWRLQVTTSRGVLLYGARAGACVRAHPVSGKMLTSAGLTSGNANCPWGANLVGGADWPDENTPPSSSLEQSIVLTDCYLYNHSPVGFISQGRWMDGAIRTMRRPLHPAVGEWNWNPPPPPESGWIEVFVDPTFYDGVGSWTDNDGGSSFIPLGDRVLFPVSVAGSPIQDITNPQAAHVWYATVHNNYHCSHGFAAVPAGITGPVSTARFPGLAAYPWSVLEQVKAGQVVDYTPEPSVWSNLEQEFNITTAPVTSVGNAKSIAAGPVYGSKVYMIAHGADSVSVWGLILPLIHEFELVEPSGQREAKQAGKAVEHRGRK